MSSVKITRVDKGYGRLLTRLLGQAPQMEVTVGVHDDAGSEASDSGDLTISDIACIQEYGGPDNNPPERSWLRDWYDESEADNRQKLSKLMEAVASGKLASKEQALEQFGSLMSADIKKRIIAGIAPEQADSTAARKGSSTPLVDSGQFLGSISYRVGKT